MRESRHTDDGVIARLATDYVAALRRAENYRAEAHLLTKERDEAVRKLDKAQAEVGRLSRLIGEHHAYRSEPLMPGQLCPVCVPPAAER